MRDGPSQTSQSKASERSYAEVLVERRLPEPLQTLTYEVPASLGSKVTRGAHVVVPLGTAQTTGRVLELVPTCDERDAERIRPILAVLDESPPLSPEAFELAEWVSREYLCSRGQALRCMLPEGAEPRLERTYRAPEDSPRVQPTLFEGLESVPDIVALVRSSEEPLSLGQIRRRLGRPVAEWELTRLRQQGLLEVAWRLHRPRARPKTRLQVVLAVPPADAQEAEQSLAASRRAQRKVLRALIERSEPVPLSEFSRSRAAVDALAARGLVNVVPLEVRRRPAGEEVPLPAIPQALTPDQKAALDAILDAMEGRGARDEGRGARGELRVQSSEFKVQSSPNSEFRIPNSGFPRSVLLHGVTGSGKTEVYLRAAQVALGSDGAGPEPSVALPRRAESGGARGSAPLACRAAGTALILVPEIALTPRAVALFRERFGDAVAVLHSALSTGERYDEWERIRRGKARVVVGARSAVFAPLLDIRLVVVDEAHEASYKQDAVPHYDARRVAEWRARRHGAVMVFGSATPSVEQYWAARGGKMRLLTLPTRIGGASLPEVEIVDLRQEKREFKKNLLSQRLIEELDATLARGQQAILFLNRRGYAPFVLCWQCGHSLRCPDCAVSLVFHKQDRTVRCHHCDYSAAAPATCEVCQSPFLSFSGTGTERSVEAVQDHLPGARIVRMDRETVSRKGAHARILSAFARGEADILLGTQMVTKGHDFPRVILVGILTADTGLNFPDFRAPEFTFQVLSQASGRAGRGPSPGRVIIQTFQPHHHAIRAAAAHDFVGFYEGEIADRQERQYPPFSRLGRVVATAESLDVARRTAEDFGAGARAAAADLGGGAARVVGPSPAPLHRLRGRYRWHVEVFAPDHLLVPVLRRALDETPRNDRALLTVDVDPISLM